MPATYYRIGNIAVFNRSHVTPGKSR